MIAYLGTGHLGANFVKAFLQREEEVQVWNKTAAKAKALEEFGAKAFEDVVEAVRGASRIHLTLKDDTSVNEVLEKAKAGFEPGVLIIDHTTTSAQGAAERTELWKGRGYTYLHAPVFMGPVNALESTGTMLVSGDPDIINAVEPELAKMTGVVLNFGPKNNTAAGMKLIGNLFLVAMTAGLTDALTLAKAMDISPDNLTTLFETWNPGTAVLGRLYKITSGTFDQPTWELDMARKDTQLMMEEATHGGQSLKAIPAIAAEMDRWIARGEGKSDWTVIGKDVI
ncbi:MAG: NAD(P)-dependent oxidoreductase [Flavipsychrobacter sp.]|jgi:3-hydroxyisobutyrate dehydrogenase|nr:NAD(P)-dependent oxidoreductase [Flavipsychrobacter sp.]